MNKTRRRAIQKHRAKDQKFAARRKAESEQAGGARARAQMQTPAPAARPRSTARERSEAGSLDSDVSTESASE